MSSPGTNDAGRRREYLDWLRGIAVLVMIAGHVFDSWTRLDARHSWQFAWGTIITGLGAPLFLFLAGVSVALSSGSRVRRTGDRANAVNAGVRRGLRVFALAFAFRLQSWLLGRSSASKLLTVDILNILGPAVIAASALWGTFRSARARCAAFVAATLSIALLTPVAWTSPVLDRLPDALEAYLRPVRPFSNFCVFPWAAFAFAGALAGVLIEAARTRQTETRVHGWLFACGSAVACGAYAASFLPSPYAHSEFWGSSPAFFLLRAGVLTAVTAFAYAWHLRSTPSRWSPVHQLGRTSLFIYWIHVEMVYGLVSLPLHGRLSHPEAWGAFAAFALFMLLCSLAKERAAAWWSRRSRESAPTAHRAPMVKGKRLIAR
jgi:uncharacterized membrane protein